MPSPGGGEWRRRPPTGEEAPRPPSPVLAFPKALALSWSSPHPRVLRSQPVLLVYSCAVNSPGGAPASSSVCGRSPAAALPPARPPRVASARSVCWSRASPWTVSPHPRGRRAGRWGWVVGGPEPPGPWAGRSVPGVAGCSSTRVRPRQGWMGPWLWLSQDLEVGGRSSRAAAWPDRHGLLSVSKLPGRKPATCDGSLAFLGSGGKA